MEGNELLHAAKRAGLDIVRCNGEVYVYGPPEAETLVRLMRKHKMIFMEALGDRVELRHCLPPTPEIMAKRWKL